MQTSDQPVIFGVVYIPPEYTKYSPDEAFNEIQQEYLSLLNISKYICLVGDFILDDNDHNNNNVSDYVDNYTEVLESLSLPVERSSMDMIRNRYENMLLEFCKGNSLFIVNGRVGKDKNIGRFTCRNASVVDYCISSPYLLKSFKDFDILDSSKPYSDVHSPITICFSSDNFSQSSQNEYVDSRKPYC